MFLFYLTVLFACMICFYYNVCDCHAFIKGNLLTYLLTRDHTSDTQRVRVCCSCDVHLERLQNVEQ